MANGFFEGQETAHFLRRRQVLQGLAALALPFGAPSFAANKKNSLVVGGLPVTCNLTLPVSCVAKATSNSTAKAGTPRFEYEYSKYNGWPEIKESLMTGRIQAAYMLAPMVMDLASRCTYCTHIQNEGCQP